MILRRGCIGALALTCIVGPAAHAAAVVRLTAAQERSLGLRTALVVAARSAPIASLPGTFVRPPSGRSAVSAPFAGAVQSVEVIEGQSVRAGQALATVFSREALGETAALAQARSESALAAAAAERTRRLANEGVIAGARAAEAESRAAAARSVLSAKSQSVRSAGLTASGRYVLRAPFAGRVVDVQVATGQGVEAMATAFVVDREGRIQVEAAMPAALAGRVRAGAPAAVEGAEGQVIAVGGEIDPRTRSLSVRVEIPPRPDFIPGRSTRLELFDRATAGLSAPRSAVTRIQGRDAVFVRTTGGFVPASVQVLGYSGDRAILSGAIKAGDAVAVSAVSELKSMAER